MRLLLLLLLTACSDPPCCIDPKIRETCDVRLYERDSMNGGKLTGWSQCIGGQPTFRRD